MQAELDHLVVTAPTLEGGTEALRARLGVAPRAGGAHPDMGTHNALLRLGRGVYLEVIAIDPAAATPAGARWFDLDAGSAGVALATWVARTPDLEASVAAAGYDPGPIRPMRRAGLHWRIAFPDDGALLAGGLLPPLIEWPQDALHPAERLPDDGLALVALEGTAPDPEAVREQLRTVGLDAVLAIDAGPVHRLRAHIATPAGTVAL